MENDYESNYLTPPNEYDDVQPDNMVLTQEGEADIELIETDLIILRQEGYDIYLQKSSIENLIKLLKQYGNK